MKLLHILARLPAPPNDGGAVYVYNMLKELSRLGNKLTIVSFLSNKHEQDLSETKKLGKVYATDGLFKPYGPLSILKSSITRQPVTIQHRMNRNIMKKLLHSVESRPDAILLEGLHTSAFTDIVRKRFPDVPVVLRQVNVEYLLLKKNGELSTNLLKKLVYYDQARIMKAYEMRAMKQADYVTAISQNDINEYKKHLPDSSFFLNTAGANIVEKTGISRDPSIMLAVSNWRWQPNLDGLIWFLKQVWPVIYENKPELHFHIAGGGLSESFRQKFQHTNIHYLGFVDNIDTLRCRASIFVAPLLSGSGMKLKVIEALAAGLPIVTTGFGSEGIEIEKNIHYLHADNADQFAKAVISLTEDKNLRENLSHRGIERIKTKYLWNQKARELSSFLEQTVIKESGIKGR